MSSKKYAAPLRLEPERSRRLAVLLCVSVGGAAILPFAIAMSMSMRAVVVAAVILLGYYGWRRHFGPTRITRLVWDEYGAWMLRLADGSEWEAQLVGDSVVTPELMILNFRAGHRRLHVIVLGDVLDADTRRRLRVRLLLEGVSPGDVADQDGDSS